MSPMLQLTRKVEYALHLMLEVALHAEGPISTAEVANRRRMPYEFLRKVVQRLVSDGLLLSERGTGGGLSLARPAREITVLEIVRAFGPLAPRACAVHPPDSDPRDWCSVYPVWDEVHGQVNKVLSNVFLSDLAEREARLVRLGSSGRIHREAALVGLGVTV